ncbi:dephospho-CoA kinase [Streptomyces sp. M19]
MGLTGGIGAGKSEVSRLLSSYGAVLIDSDRIAREVVEPGRPDWRPSSRSSAPAYSPPRARSTGPASARSSSTTPSGCAR